MNASVILKDIVLIRSIFYCSRFSTEFSFYDVFSENNKKHVIDILEKQPKDAEWMKYKSSKSGKQSAVLVPLCVVDGEPAVILTLRSNKLRGHSGQVSFPGGRMDSKDKNLLETALRETEEEIGLSRNVVDIWGQLPPMPSRKMEIVSPIIGYCGQIDLKTLNINQNEVCDIFTASLQSLCHKENQHYTTFVSPSFKYRLPVFLGQKHKVWGMTAAVLHKTLLILLPHYYQPSAHIKFGI